MASGSLQSSNMEFHEPEITKPQPLRIIKRSKTISGSSASGESFCGGRSPSASSQQSEGSPPPSLDRPLTTHKLRRGRGSVLDGSFDGLSEPHTGSTISELFKKQAEKVTNEDDPDVTPKARKQVPRTVSAGAYLRNEFHRGSNDVGRCSVRGIRGSTTSSDVEFMQYFPEVSSNPDRYPQIPERRFSKSKSFILRAIGGRNNSSGGQEKANRIRKVDTSSKDTLIRRLSRGRRRSRTHCAWNATQPEGGFCSSAGSCESASLDIADVSFNSSLFTSCGEAQNSSYTSDTAPLLASTGNALLCPLISVTPEVSSVDAGSCALWVAVTIHGSLCDAEKSRVREMPKRSSGAVGNQTSGTSQYGYLYSMRIDILPAQNCYIAELVGDLHDPNPMRAGETRLILVKVNLSRTIFSSHIKESSEGLMADLENDLGGTLTPYLRVRLKYKHSGFHNYEKPILTSDGVSSHTTYLQTDASAVIRRHNSLSAWSPRASQTLKSALTTDPLVKLIGKHLPPDKANEAINILLGEHRRTPVTRRNGDAGGSSEETVKPFTSVISPIASSTASTSLVNALPKTSSVSSYSPSITPAPPFARYSSPTSDHDQEGIDPARKIWTEMRRTSRSHNIRHRRHSRSSISADQFFSVDEYQNSTRNSSSGATSSTLDSSHDSERAMGPRGWARLDDNVEYERNKIRQTALKNKRSMGADTLRSIAPSVTKSVTKVKGGTIGGLGLGVGKLSWSWGPPWW